jgi:hypothetical protein
MSLPIGFEEKHGGRRARVQGVGGARVHRDLDAHVREVTPSIGEAVVLCAEQERGVGRVVHVRVPGGRPERRRDLLVRERGDVLRRHFDDRK